MKQILFVAVLLSAAAVAMAAQSKVIIPVDRISGNNGQQMYAGYCAPCHGVDGRGNGPQAKVLIYAPADLTQLSRENNGVYPALHVNSVLRFGFADGPATDLMPYWAHVLGHLYGHQSRADMNTLRIHNIVAYVETLQAR